MQPTPHVLLAECFTYASTCSASLSSKFRTELRFVSHMCRGVNDRLACKIHSGATSNQFRLWLFGCFRVLHLIWRTSSSTTLAVTIMRCCCRIAEAVVQQRYFLIVFWIRVSLNTHSVASRNITSRSKSHHAIPRQIVLGNITYIRYAVLGYWNGIALCLDLEDPSECPKLGEGDEQVRHATHAKRTKSG